MSLSMYDLSIPRFKHIMNTLKAILAQAETYAKEKNIAEGVLPATRLIADMHPLANQVQIVTDQCKGCASRLAEVERPAFEDNETTIAQLIDRLDKTIAYLDTIPADKINGTEDKDITLELPSITMQFKGQKYLQDFVMPNVYFHFTTAYNILRTNGMPLSKKDFIGNIF